MAFEFCYYKVTLILVILSFLIYNHNSVCVLCMSSMYMCIAIIGGSILLMRLLYMTMFDSPKTKTCSFNKNSSSSNVIQDDFCLGQKPILKNKRVMTDLDMTSITKLCEKKKKLSNIDEIIDSIKSLDQSDIGKIIDALEMPLSRDDKANNAYKNISSSNASKSNDKELTTLSKHHSVSKMLPPTSSSTKSSKSKSLSPEKKTKKTVISDYHRLAECFDQDKSSKNIASVQKSSECISRKYSLKSKNESDFMYSKPLSIQTLSRDDHFTKHASSKGYRQRDNLTQLVKKTKFNTIEGVLSRARSLSPDFKPNSLTRVSSTSLYPSMPYSIMRKY